MINGQKLKKTLLNTTLFSKLRNLGTPRFWSLTGIIFLCVILILTIAYIKRSELRNLFAPPSPQSINENLLEKISALDQIIFHQLSTLSVANDNISLRQLPRKEGLIQWNYNIITVALPPGTTLNQVQTAFKRGFAFFELEELKWHFSNPGINCLKIDVLTQGFRTHQLIFNCPASSLHEEKTTKYTYQVSIIIDDLGKNYKAFKKLLMIDIPLTYSILPFQPYSTRIAQEAHEKNREVILHLPLEPWDSANQTVAYGTLLTSMDNDQLLTQLERNINSVPYIAGISNHMGSKFTEDQDKMEIVLKKAREKGLYFLDSRTTKKTVGYTLSKAMDIKTAERDLFIDNNKDPLAIEKQLKKLPRLAKKNGGYAIAIGHPHRSTIDTLKKIIPSLIAQGAIIVPLSQLVN